MKMPKLFSTSPVVVVELFDGELIIDEFYDSENAKVECLHYLIFDCIIHNASQKVFT
jgi:hypothetical protein